MRRLTPSRGKIPQQADHAGHTGEKRPFDLAHIRCKRQDAPCFPWGDQINRRTADGRDMQTCSGLLSKAIHLMVKVEAEKNIDNLPLVGKITALTEIITGLDDFKLIACPVALEAA